MDNNSVLISNIVSKEGKTQPLLNLHSIAVLHSCTSLFTISILFCPRYFKLTIYP